LSYKIKSEEERREKERMYSYYSEIFITVEFTHDLLICRYTLWRISHVADV